jgi:hypothetical protein
MEMAIMSGFVAAMNLRCAGTGLAWRDAENYGERVMA